jgi:hypothetical protein
MLPLKVVIVQPAIVLLAFFNGEPVTELNGYAGYLVRSKTAKQQKRTKTVYTVVRGF